MQLIMQVSLSEFQQISSSHAILNKKFYAWQAHGLQQPTNLVHRVPMLLETIQIFGCCCICMQCENQKSWISMQSHVQHVVRGDKQRHRTPAASMAHAPHDYAAHWSSPCDPFTLILNALTVCKW